MNEEVRERAGVQTRDNKAGHVTVVEREDCIFLLAHNGDGTLNTMRVTLSIDEARHLAKCLRRIAWRVEARQ